MSSKTTGSPTLPSNRASLGPSTVGLPLAFGWLMAGLVGFGIGLALLVRAKLGLDPWDVLNQGIARHLGIQIGWVVDIVGALVMLAWIPLHQRPGVGTLINIIVIGLVVNLTLDLVPSPRGLLARIAMLAMGIFLNGISTGCYIGAGLGPGPRDGLMTGLAARGHSVRVVRTAIELSVLAAGFFLGGTVGVGTVAYALCIGPFVHFFIPRLNLATLTGKVRTRKGVICNQ